MAGHCWTCGARLVGRQRKFCSRRCKSQDANHRHQNYVVQGARGVARKLRFIRSRGGRCQRCGYGTNYAALVWHHVDPRLKSFEVDLRAMSNRTLSALAAEIEKCQLLCQNCHMEVHHPSAIID